MKIKCTMNAEATKSMTKHDDIFRNHLGNLFIASYSRVCKKLKLILVDLPFSLQNSEVVRHKVGANRPSTRNVRRKGCRAGRG